MHKRSVGWITIKIYNEIKGLKVPTYEPMLFVYLMLLTVLSNFP